MFSIVPLTVSAAVKTIEALLPGAPEYLAHSAQPAGRTTATWRVWTRLHDASIHTATLLQEKNRRYGQVDRGLTNPAGETSRPGHDRRQRMP